jgi:hypothetical protein
LKVKNLMVYPVLYLIMGMNVLLVNQFLHKPYHHNFKNSTFWDRHAKIFSLRYEKTHLEQECLFRKSVAQE